jgi:predicted nucleic acid-binding protein
MQSSSELKRRGETIGDFDKLIAAVALTHEAAIVSTDSHFLDVPGLRFISP